VTNELEPRVIGKMSQVRFSAREEIIDGNDRVILRQQAIAHVRADESGSSSNQNAQKKYPVELDL